MGVGRTLTAMGQRLAQVVKGGIVERARFSGEVNEAQVSMLSEDDVDDAPIYGDMGVAFRLKEGLETLVVNVMGDGDKPTVIGTSQRGYRPTEKPGGGEVPEGCGGLHYLGAWRVYIDDAGAVYLAGATDTSEPALLGATAVTLYNAHVHGSPFGPTAAPTTTLDSAKSTKLFIA